MLTTGSRSFQRGTVGSVHQRAPKLPAVKVGGLIKSSAMRPESNQTSAAWVWVPDDFDHPQCLMDCNFAALLPKETHMIPLERS